MTSFDALIESTLQLAFVAASGAGSWNDPHVDVLCVSTEVAGEKLQELRGRSSELFRDTDGGNADRFAARFGRRVLAEVDGRGQRRYYVADQTNLWGPDETGVVSRMAEFVLDEMYRRADELDPGIESRVDGDAEAESDPFDATRQRGEQLRAHARRSDTLRCRRNMAEIATDKYGLRIPGIQHFDTDTRLVACGEGKVLELSGDTVKLRDRQLEDMCHYTVNAPYDPRVLDAPPTLIRQFIDSFLPEENRVKLLFKLLGHALPGGNPNRYFVILKGGSTSGKTQLIAAIQQVLGGYVGTTPATIFRANKDDRPRPDIIRIYRKRLAFLPEASKKSWELHASRIKQFTGGDRDPQRAMRSDVFHDERPLCMPVVYTNEMPKIIGMDAATKRRVIVPTMNHTIPREREDVTIKERFISDPEVAAWLFAALIRGYVDAQREGLHDVETEFSMSTGEGTSQLYHLSDFLEWLRETERLTEVPQDERTAYGVKGTYVSLEDMFTQYTSWCRTFGNRYDRLESLGFKEFNAELRDNHGFTTCKSGGHRWEGLRLKSTSLGELSSLAKLAMN